MAQNLSRQRFTILVSINGELSMILKVKQGRNQEGLCFVSPETPEFELGVYDIHYDSCHHLVEVRLSKQVPSDLIVMDERIYNMLGCSDGSEVSLDFVNDVIPICSKLSMSVSSVKELDNQRVADAISKRVNDLRDDFNGLIFQIGQDLLIDRLGLRFKVLSMTPMNTDYSSSRIAWSALEEIYLEPAIGSKIFNMCCIIEIGAASQISDVTDDLNSSSSSYVQRYESALSAIKEISENFPYYGSDSQFCGIAYSDEVILYQLHDSQTGKLIDSSSIHSPSLFKSFIEWINTLVQSHKGKPSNPGEALRIAIEAVSAFRDINEYPTILIFCSSGVHTAGPNPVKVVKNLFQNSNLVLLSLSLGKESKLDVMEAIAHYAKGRVLNVTNLNQIGRIPSLLNETLNQVM